MNGARACSTVFSKKVKNKSYSCNNSSHKSHCSPCFNPVIRVFLVQRGGECMFKNKAYKFRLYPNEKQKEQINKTIGSARFVYNHFLNEWTTTYKETGKG
ncbi:helix-turn-helix domain-containing protein, partial [Alkalibacterium thalassium]